MPKDYRISNQRYSTDFNKKEAAVRMSKKKITMTIDEEIFLKFKKLCKDNAMKVSSKVELMMRNFNKEKEKK